MKQKNYKFLIGNLKKSFKKNKIPQHQHLRQVKMYNSLSLFHHLEYVFTHSISLIYPETKLQIKNIY